MLLGALTLPGFSSAASSKASKSCVTLYQYKNYKGKSKTICGSTKNLKTVKFDNKTSSIKLKLAKGKRVIFYNNANYNTRGGSFMADSSDSNSMKSLPSMFDNKISSIQFK
jgi:hypothetical protein